VTVQRTLVTGGMGYIGSAILARLRDAGEVPVSYDRDYARSRTEGVEYVQGELFDLPRLLDALRCHGIGRILHVAAMPHPQHSVAFPLTTVAANVNGTVSVLEAARVAGIRRIVQFSSEAAYGHRPEPLVDERCPLEPITPYGATKVAAELFGTVYGRVYGLDVTALRVTEVYGPGNRGPQVLCDIVDAVLEGRPYVLAEGASHAMHFVHVEDVARAAVLAVNRDQLPQPAYNISGAAEHTLADAVDIIKSIIPTACIDIGPGFLDGVDRQGKWDITAAERDLGFRPAWTLEDGIRRFLASRVQPAGSSKDGADATQATHQRPASSSRSR
jgi:UDP-glucose 4-epimerase